MADERKENQKVKEITDKLEQGLNELFESEKYKNYLNTMSKFHNYSFNNTLLISMQKPEATLVAGYRAWEKNFERHVKKGEKGIRILAFSPYKIKEERYKSDPVTGEIIFDENGIPQKEQVETKIPAFRAVSVFDVSQTYGKPIPALGTTELLSTVEGYENFVNALMKVSAVPIEFKDITGASKGYFHIGENRIAVQDNMSESHTLKTMVHEIAHSILHNKEINKNILEPEKDRNTKEVEAESIAYTVCQHFGIDTSDYSFSYIAGWSSNRSMNELKSSLDTIRKTASEIITGIEGALQELQLNRNIEQASEEKTSKSNVVSNFRAKTNKLFHNINGLDPEEIEETVKCHVQAKINEYDFDAIVIDAAVVGSRCRGMERDDSDLDVVVEFSGNEREDDLFNALHEDEFFIGDVKVDINPITEERTGTLETYLPQVDDYLEEIIKSGEQEHVNEKVSIKDKLEEKKAVIEQSDKAGKEVSEKGYLLLQ